MKDFLAKIGARDVLIGGGTVVCAIGAGLIYVPAGLLVFGAIALYLGLYGVPAWR